jgi:STE24 endopeptidase
LLLVFCEAPAATLSIPAGAEASAHFDAELATQAWLATVPPADKAKSDAYFAGNCWLILWDFLLAAAVMILLLETRISAKLRDLTERWRLPSLSYFALFATITAVLLFPWSWYENFLREHHYGLSNQSFASWFRDQAVGFAVLLLLGGLAFTILLAVIRRFRRTWHVWAACVCIVLSTFLSVIAPVVLAPLFNTYKPLRSGPLRDAIVSLAHENGIAAKEILEENASKQSKRVSAFVSGMFGTDRITLNDNLLARCSPEAILSVMGHEMGHYVLHHIYYGILLSAVFLFVAAFIFRWAMERAIGRWGAHWQIRGIGDAAALPLAVLILSVIAFVSMPLANTVSRAQEYEADIFGLSAARQPDGEAEVDLLLGEYRKLDPTPLEEFLFFDHPSGRTRIFAAMRWKAENLCLFDLRLPCTNYPAWGLKPSPNGPSRPNATPLQ